MGGLRVLYEGAVIGTGGSLLTGLAFDGRYLYSSAPAEKTVYRLDENGAVIQKFQTERSYVGLCYDGINRCFWAITRESPLYIFRVTPQFEEFDRVRITGCVTDQLRALDIDTGRGSLLVLAGEEILTLSLSGEVTHTLPVSSATKDFCCFGEYLLLGGAGLEIHKNRQGPVESLGLPANLQVAGVSVLYHSADRMVCTMLCTRSHRYNSLLQTVIEPQKPFERPQASGVHTALIHPTCADCPVQGSVSVGLAALSGVLEQLLAALMQSGAPPYEE